MSKVYCVMLYGYPKEIFSEFDLAVEFCTKFFYANTGSSLSIDEYELDKPDSNKSFIWSTWQHLK